MFEFQSETNEKKFKGSVDVNPILYSNSENPEVFYIVDHPLPYYLMNKLTKFISGMNKGLQYSILSALPFQPNEKDLEKSIISLYGNHGTDLSKYIPEWSKVVTIGRALYSVTKSDDLSIEGFYDTLQWKTSFFAPDLKSYIYPCPTHFSWLEKDTFERFFTLKQMELSRRPITKKRLLKPKLIKVEDTDEFLDKWTSFDGITSFDLETKGLDPWSSKGKILCLTLAFESERNTAYFLKFKDINRKKLETFFKNKKLVGNNLKYDMRWMRVHAGLPRSSLNLYWDNMNSSHAINELQYNSLKSDAWLYTPYGGYDLPLSQYQDKYPACKEDYSLIPEDILMPYATMDALVSIDCYFAHQEAIRELDALCKLDNGWSIQRALTEVTVPTISMFTDVEINGMYYDWDKLRAFSKELQEEIDRRRVEIYKVLGMPESVNIDSGDQLGKFLEQKGWENPGLSKKKIYLTNEASMTYWRKKGHTEVDLLQQYTECVTVMKTFVGVEKNEKGKPTGYWQYRKDDNRVHGNFSVMLADSHRNKSYDPNLQNVIKNSTVKINGVLLHVRVRECFSIPSPDFYISENDAAGLQLRIAATLSNDPVMRDIFLNQGGDIHSLTARAVFCPEVSLEEFIANKKEKPYKAYRQKSKAINFGLLFGSSSRSFASSSLLPEWTYQEAIDYVKEYKLDEKQSKYYKLLIKDLHTNKEIIDKQEYLKDQLIFSFYWAAADDIRTKFFDTYKGLSEWHTAQHEFGKKNGYVQSSWGPIRRVPFLVYRGADDDGARIKNYENICLNSPVQNFEAYYMMWNMSRVNKDLHDKRMGTHLIGNIHDSFISYIKTNELQKAKEIYLSRFHEPIPIMNGIPYEIELGYSDYTKGEFWGITEHNF